MLTRSILEYLPPLPAELMPALDTLPSGAGIFRHGIVLATADLRFIVQRKATAKCGHHVHVYNLAEVLTSPTEKTQAKPLVRMAPHDDGTFRILDIRELSGHTESLASGIPSAMDAFLQLVKTSGNLLGSPQSLVDAHKRLQSHFNGFLSSFRQGCVLPFGSVSV